MTDVDRLKSVQQSLVLFRSTSEGESVFELLILLEEQLQTVIEHMNTKD